MHLNVNAKYVTVPSKVGIWRGSCHLAACMQYWSAWFHSWLLHFFWSTFLLVLIRRHFKWQTHTCGLPPMLTAPMKLPGKLALSPAHLVDDVWGQPADDHASSFCLHLYSLQIKTSVSRYKNFENVQEVLYFFLYWRIHRFKARKTKSLEKHNLLGPWIILLSVLGNYTI